MEIEIAVGALLLALLVFLATIDLAFSLLSDISLRRLAGDAEEERPRAAGFLKEILENRPVFRFALSSAIQLLLIGFSVLVTIAVLDFTYIRAQVVLYALLIGLAATVLFRQIVPRLVVRRNPEGVLLLLLPAVKPLYLVVSFVSAPISSLLRTSKEQSKLDTTTTPDSSDEKSEDYADDIHALMEVGEAEGLIEEKDRELIESMVEFSDTRAGEIMTPRTEIVALPIDATVRAARDLIVDQKYSRLPVYRDSIDNIEGVIYVRDLLQAWALGKEEQPIEEILRPAYFVPETKSASELLKSMQLDHVQLATVIDEYGGVAGIVTVEDIIEEIVGEIEDEDIEEEEIIEIVEGQDGYWDVLGSTGIDKIERLFEIDIEDEDFSTIAGMVTSEAGYVPKEGEKLSLYGLDVEILRADEKRIHLLRIRPAAETGATAEPEA
ncbi:MAG: hemolysin family protein [Pyrinomonadaceae bacterium]|nr:hemolysin family protein [Pyrinomonadaceae bacterium]